MLLNDEAERIARARHALGGFGCQLEIALGPVRRECVDVGHGFDLRVPQAVLRLCAADAGLAAFRAVDAPAFCFGLPLLSAEVSDLSAAIPLRRLR